MNDQYIIFIGDDGWRVGGMHDDEVHVNRVPVERDAPLESHARAAREQLASMGYDDQPVALALSSSRCLCATFSTGELQRKGRRRAMGFMLEENLPVSIEEVVADYLDTDRDEALGVCSEVDKLREIVEALEKASIPVRHICPTALLSAAYAARMHPDVGGVLLCSVCDEGENAQSQYDWVRLDKQKPTCWRWLADDAEAMREQMASYKNADESPAPVALIGFDHPHGEFARACDGLECRRLEDVNYYQAAVYYGANLLEESQSPWIDLRRGPLAPSNQYQVYRRPIGALVASVVVLLVSVCGVMQWRGRQYANLRKQYLAQQVTVFKEALRDQRVPPADIKRRMLSERRKLARLSGEDMENAGKEALKSTSALVHLKDVLENLPANLRYRILEMNIKPDLIRLEGQARSHADADDIAAALREAGIYQVEPPETRALGERGVSFGFIARPLPAETSGGKEQR